MKQKTKRRIVTVVAIVLALMLILPMLISVLTATAAAVSQEEINGLQDNAEQLAAQKKALTAKLDALESDQNAAIQKKELLDEQIDVIQQQIDNVTAQINEFANLIAAQQAELEKTEALEKEQYELFCIRVRAMEENGTVSYWSILFNAASFSDLLGRLDFVSEVMEYDEGVIDQLKETRQKIADDKASLETEKAEVEAAKSDLSDRQTELKTQLSKAQALVNDIEERADEYSQTLDDIEKEEAKVQADIKAKQEELARQGKEVLGEGDYLWPVPASHRITSNFGYREHPTQGGYKFHYGIDIGVASGNNVLASRSGTVLISQYSSSYGNYIVISHGGGDTTLYAHMSKRLVSAGEVVTQGDVIGYSGSTGWSTGPHVHFEITENGTRVDPESKF